MTVGELNSKGNSVLCETYLSFNSAPFKLCF